MSRSRHRRPAGALGAVWGLLILLGAAMPGASPAPAQTTGPDSAPATRPDVLAPDEAEVAELIRRMGSDIWKVREDASKKLAAMGPQIVPVLEKYRNHPDLETATRVRAIIAQFAWITKGAMVVRILPDSQAERLKVRVGDVFVRVDDLDVTDLADLQKIDLQRGRTYVTWRSGSLLRFRVGPGLMGCYCANWDQARGGNDHARGVAAMADGRFDEAYPRVLAAYNAGTNDSWTVIRLWGLAEYALDHKQATAIHTRFLVRYPTFTCSWSHDDIDAGNYGLPMSSAYTAHLLGRMNKEAFSEDLYHRLDSYFVLLGRNLPLARQTTARPWPQAPGPNAEYRVWHANCRMAVADHDGRWKDVAAEHAGAPTDLWGASLAVRAAVELGDVDAACRIGRELIEHYQRQRRPAVGPGDRPDTREASRLYEASCVLYAVAAALADGQDDKARALLDQIAEVDQALLGGLLDRPAAQAFRRAAIAPKMAALLAKYTSSAEQDLLEAYLLFLGGKDGLTAKEWDEAVGRFGSAHRDPRGLRRLNAKTLLRLGQWDQARPLLQDPALADSAALRGAMELFSANRARLETDWAPLKGVAEVYPAADKGAWWAVRYDGRVFHVAAGGAIREFPGLAPGQTHHDDCFDEIRCFPAGTVYFRRSRVYLLDETAGRWVPTYSSPRIVGKPDWRTPATPAVLRCLLKLRQIDPAARGEIRAVRHVAGPGRWWVHQFRDELALAANDRTLQVLDLSEAIARLAGKPGRAAVYRVHPLGRLGMLLPTDVGLWLLRADGRLGRVKLPAKDTDVMVSVMDWPRRAGKVYVGAAPQQGGAVYEIDSRSGEARLTGGYCGKGPDDAFAARDYSLGAVHCEAAIQRIHERRLAREQAK